MAYTLLLSQLIRDHRIMAHKTQKMPFGRYIDWRKGNPPNLDRTSTMSEPGINGLAVVRVWNSREVMARAIRAQQRRAPHNSDWKACVPLRDGEGY